MIVWLCVDGVWLCLNKVRCGRGIAGYCFFIVGFSCALVFCSMRMDRTLFGLRQVVIPGLARW